MTLVVNLYGQPGAGKSITRALVFARLKMLGVAAEETPEIAKDFTWEGRKVALACQPYVFGKQLRNYERLLGQVDVIVSDGPLALSAFYDQKYCAGKYPGFQAFVRSTVGSIRSIDYFLTRTKPYEARGRNQTETEATAIAHEMRDWLDRWDVNYEVLPGCHEDTVRSITEDAMAHLQFKA